MRNLRAANPLLSCIGSHAAAIRRPVSTRADRDPRRGARARGRYRRLRDLAPPPTAQRRHPDPAPGRARAGDRRRHRDPRRDAVGVLVQARERHPDRRRRGLRDPDPVPARPPGAEPGIADHHASSRRCSRASPGSSSAVAGYPDRFRDRIAVLVPAYDEADNVGAGPRPDPGRSLRGRDRGPGRRRRLAGRNRRGRGRPRRGRRPPRDQPRRRRSAAHRLPAARRLRGRDRRDPRRRRTAPARGDGAAGQAGARRRGRGRPRIARARRGRAQPPARGRRGSSSSTRSSR